MSILPRRTVILPFVEGKTDRFMVSIDYKMTSLEHVPEIFYCLINGKQLSVIGKVLGL